MPDPKPSAPRKARAASKARGEVQLLSMPEAAEILSCSASHIYTLIARGHLRPVELSASTQRPKTRVRSDDLQAYIERQTRIVPVGRSRWT